MNPFKNYTRRNRIPKRIARRHPKTHSIHDLSLDVVGNKKQLEEVILEIRFFFVFNSGGIHFWRWNIFLKDKVIINLYQGTLS